MIDRNPGQLNMKVKVHYDDMVRTLLLLFLICCSMTCLLGVNPLKPTVAIWVQL